ncbi:multiple sugar transport system substrate-binding protein [Paenibacillus castaneae]|uniref:ABC transporter substrate-binding protein n=1 Tax=Paenibacillus castaneae TaxID=474957 RepID=UPI000C9B7086|nr:extracellular solute-binding protein [Paenibacillus castaneae]NIK79557.1 multiple sugar transport system substrate-binding protein [Paenibacillus castaneae]
MFNKTRMVTVAALLALSLSACSSGNGNSTNSTKGTNEPAPKATTEAVVEGTKEAPKVKLNYWTEDRHDLTYIQEVVQRFNETNTENIEVELKGLSENYNQSVDIAFSSKQAPDIIRTTPSNFIPFVKKGYLEPLDGYMNDAMKTKFQGALIDKSNMMNGQIFSLPNYGYSSRLIYNVDLFNKAGITSPPKTLNEMVEVAKKLTEAGKDIGAYGFAINFKGADNSFEKAPRSIAELSGIGGYGYDFKTGKYDFSGFADIMKAFKQMKDDGSMLPGVEALDIDPLRAQFAEGKIGMYLSISAEPGVYQSQFPTEVNWSAALPPTISGDIAGVAGYWKTGPWLSISSQTKNKKEAWTFLEYMYSDEVLRTYYEDGYGLSLLPAIVAQSKDPKIPGIEGFLPTQYDGLWPISPKVTVEGTDFPNLFIKYAISGGDLDKMITDVNTRYNAALDKARASGDVTTEAMPDFNAKSMQGMLVK